MKSAALGIRMHSGWGVLVAVHKNPVEILERRRIVVSERNAPRGNQPYHQAQALGLPEAEKFLAEYAAEILCLAEEEIGNAISGLKARGYEAITAAVLLASGRKLPALPQILAAHPLIHAAEGDLFRDTVRRALKSFGIPVIGIREREIEGLAGDAFGMSATKLIGQLASAGKVLGSPWNADHKSAALAACIALQLREKTLAAKA